MNNPLIYNDGEFFRLIPFIAAGVFATGNTVVRAIRGDIHNFRRGLGSFVQGAIAGFALGAAWLLAPTIPVAGKTIQTGMTIYAALQIGSGVLGMIGGGLSEGRRGIIHGAKVFLGNFYLDEHNFWGGVLQGISRHIWEMPQTLAGQAWTQIRNIFKTLGKVDYWGGTAFATNENSRHKRGISLGNYINIDIKEEISGNFDRWVSAHPMYMHEYGHTIDSRIFGFFYLLVIGIPSLISAMTVRQIAGEPPGVTTHSFRWYEMRANRNAANYFKNYFGLDWNSTCNGGQIIETYYPRKKR